MCWIAGGGDVRKAQAKQAARDWRAVVVDRFWREARLARPGMSISKEFGQLQPILATVRLLFSILKLKQPPHIAPNSPVRAVSQALKSSWA